MALVGLFCPPTVGHLNPMTVLGRTLLKRGHSVTLFGIADVEAFVRSCGLDFRVLGASEYPVGSVEKSSKVLGRLRGIQALRFTVNAGSRLAEITCRFASSQVEASGIDLMVVDQNEPAAGSVAERLQVPYLNLVNIPLNFDPDIPPPITGWAYNPCAWSRLRNRAAYNMFYWIISPITQTINQYRKTWNLPKLRTPEDSFSSAGQICQMTSTFDFPRKINAGFSYTGPFFDESRHMNLTLNGLNGKPLVYASMGTLQNRDVSVYRQIAAACGSLNVQLVISLGGSGQMDELCGLPSDSIIANYVPQLEVLTKAKLVVTHAGLNTVQEALHFGVPMVAIPVTNDQPAVAARLHRSGAGEVIPLVQLTGETLREKIVKVLEEDSFRRAAMKQRESSLKAGGVELAAELIEAVLDGGRSSKASKTSTAGAVAHEL
jgi:UDP:flavonoid glycosyltransferase YjiC (YdhE family)